MEIKVSMEENDTRSIEKAFYESNCYRNLISFYLNLADNPNKIEIVKQYIDEYKHELDLAEMHLSILQKNLVDKYFPDELKSYRNHTNFSFNFYEGIIVYYVEQNG